MPLPTYFCPPVDNLQTGDLLFPRAAVRKPRPPGAVASVLLETLSLDSPEPVDDRPLRDVLAPEFIAALRDTERPQNVSGLVTPARGGSALSSGFGTEFTQLGARLSQLGAEYAQLSTHRHALGLELAGIGLEMAQLGQVCVDKREEARRRDQMMFIIAKAFPGLIDDWLKLTMAQFAMHPLSELLKAAIERETGEGFFVGHVAMVLRETDGAHDPQGAAWVIEANTTDFSHYGVALHPYLVPGEPMAPPKDGGPLPRLRGWANRRLAMGESIWHSRHLDMTDADAARLVNEAKKYLGRPYGFFDKPKFGDPGRFYCGELIASVFRDVGGDAMVPDDNRTWKWLYDHRHLLGGAAFVERVETAVRAKGLYAKMEKEAFFLLTLPMLYLSKKLQPEDADTAPPYL